MSQFSAARFHDGHSFRCALAREARQTVHLTFLADSGVRHLCIPKRQAELLQPLQRGAGPYEIPRLAKRLRAAGRLHGITKAASRELHAAMRAQQ